MLNRSIMRPLSGRGLATAAGGRPLVVLGLESSADDTCASIVTSDRRILSNIVLKQSSLVAQYGGIHPLHAQEAHQLRMPLAIQSALKEAGMKLEELDGIAATRGPGMYGCLGVCWGAAKALAAATGKPLLGVHHMQAHALTPFLTSSPSVSPLYPHPSPRFPFLTLLLSGGHTLLLLASSPSRFKILATTHDESIGACLDKAARDLGIDFGLGGGSPAAGMERFAFPSLSLGDLLPIKNEEEEGGKAVPNFPVPFPKDLAFSYAGLRSSLTRLLSHPSSSSPTPSASSPTPPGAQLEEGYKRGLTQRFMLAAFAQIEGKVALALRGAEERGEERVRGLVVSGGVASNLILRERLRIKLDSLGYHDLPLIFPPPKYCTDNAAMIAWVGLQRLREGKIDGLDAMQKAKWSVEDCEADLEEKVEGKGKELGR
ncbi:hypothetical protein JCM8547_004468 [Rhodosporidiobolus lusitaniae]